MTFWSLGCLGKSHGQPYPQPQGLVNNPCLVWNLVPLCTPGGVIARLRLELRDGWSQCEPQDVPLSDLADLGALPKVSPCPPNPEMHGGSSLLGTLQALHKNFQEDNLHSIILMHFHLSYFLNLLVHVTSSQRDRDLLYSSSLCRCLTWPGLGSAAAGTGDESKSLRWETKGQVLESSSPNAGVCRSRKSEWAAQACWNGMWISQMVLNCEAEWKCITYISFKK